ncbi:hypothetical protein C2E23DRAFT_839328, partial [Lenzites betulinus]
MTQKLAYRAIRNKKEGQMMERRATKENMTKIVNEAEEAYGVRMKPKMIWRSLTNRHVSKECRQYWWKALHDAFMVGRHWLRPKMPDNLKARATCARCGVLESMEHILLKCEETERKETWARVERIWRSTGREWPEITWGAIMGATAVVIRNNNKERDTDAENLWKVLITESAYGIWKMRCERVIQNEGKSFTENEVENRWYGMINRRLTLDRNTTAKHLGKRSLDKEEVRRMWQPILAKDTRIDSPSPTQRA